MKQKGTKFLIVAHPDDEILIANPYNFDKIIIIFGYRWDKPLMGEKRKKALKRHPLKKKIIHLNLDESGYWRDKSAVAEYKENYADICEWLKNNIKDNDKITTHNAWGEYGHEDHKLVYKAIMDTVNCKVNEIDPKKYRTIRKIYEEEDAWTWN